MNLQTQPNSWSCLPTAFAIALDVPISGIFECCGHDGSDIVFPKRTDPHGRRSFHIAEMVEFCNVLSKAVIQVEQAPVSSNKYGDEYRLPIYGDGDGRMLRWLTFNTGVLVGIVRGNQHAVAWNADGFCYDPNGTTYPLDRFNISAFFAIKSTR